MTNAYDDYQFRGIPDGPSRGEAEFGLTFTVSDLARDQSALDFSDLIFNQGFKAMEEYMMKNGIRFANVTVTRQRFELSDDGRYEPLAPAVIVDESRATLGVSWDGRESA